ncbi:hypothetical protein D3C81_1431250 [compost metagenome]
MLELLVGDTTTPRFRLFERSGRSAVLAMVMAVTPRVCVGVIGSRGSSTLT